MASVRRPTIPYQSAKQRSYLHIHEPALAKKWDAETGGQIGPKTFVVGPPKAKSKKGKMPFKKGMK